MATDFTVHPRGALTPAALELVRARLGLLEGYGDLDHPEDIEFGYRYLNGEGPVCLSLSRLRRDLWTIELAHVDRAPAAQDVERCLAAARAVATELGLDYGVYITPEPRGAGDSADADGPAHVGGTATARGVIDKATGELSVWPTLDLDVVADMYRRRRRAAGSA
jgi:hypothetical protein